MASEEKTTTNRSEKKAAADHDERSVLSASSTIYGLMFGIGALIAHFVHQDLLKAFGMPPPDEALKILVYIPALVTGILLTMSVYFEAQFPSFRDLKKSVSAILGPLTYASAFYLALISAFAEEVLFRAALQPSLGLVITSLLFGLLHIGPNGRLSAWSLWAVLAGLLLGFTYDQTGSLWPPIAAHFLVNLVSLTRIVMDQKKA